MELQHFSHRHPLIFNFDRPRINYGYSSTCYGCWEQVSGPNYGCKECDFVLHKSCAELPHELRHPLHPKHPLLIKHQFLNSKVKCEGCNEGNVEGFTYNCFDCNFDLHGKCASLPPTIQAESHAHTLTLMRRSVSFTCDACGKEGKGMFYSCALCPFLVHLECVSFPLTVKHIRHTHPLKLTNSLEVHQPDHRLCQLCVEIVDIDYMFYYCSTCDYVNHLHCATNEELLDETLAQGFEDTELGPPYVVLKSKVGEDKIGKAVEIKHFSHEHDLELIDEQLENKEKCDACVSPISLPFYSCAQCRFFLHKSCVELPRTKSHQLHRHTLILLPKAPYISRLFVCNACDRTCNGFTYYCDKCDFDLDVHCSLIPDIIKHDGHEHQLILSSTSYSNKCSSCDSYREELMFYCADCEFTLNFKCATLPHTIRYGPYEQLFVLCYKDEDSFSDEYFCDICEEERDPKHWFYYCANLNFPAHPDCILGKCSYIKFGRHEHPLKLVDKSKDAGRLCDECGSLCYGLTYKCINCDFNLHRWCIYKTTELTRLAKFVRHEHPLKLFDKGEGVHRQCDNCGDLRFGSSHGCINCDFSLHRGCIDKTTELTSLVD